MSSSSCASPALVQRPHVVMLPATRSYTVERAALIVLAIRLA
jgi:hypothetical protein